MADNNEDQKTVVGINFGDSYASIAVINKVSSDVIELRENRDVY